MLNTKKIIVSASAITLVGVGVFGATQAFAQSPNPNHLNFVQELAQKLGLDQSKVQTAVDQIRQDNQANRQTIMQDRLKTRLDQLVGQGKINGTQEQAIIDELNALQTKYGPNTMQGKTAAERRQAMMDRQNELKTWAQSQGIDLLLIQPNFGRMGMRNGWMKPSASPTASPTT